MENSNEEFEPLFDYTRVQPAGVICLDDDLDETPVFDPKKRKISAAADEKKQHDLNSKDVKSVECDDKEEEEDWLPPPPKNLDQNSKSIGEDSTLKAIRLKKKELASFALSADEVVRAVEESVRKGLNASSQSSPSSPKTDTKQPVEPHHERAKLVISIQDKDELKQFRVYKDDKFERLFKMYAEKIKVDMKNLVFSFDGDRINPAQTPNSLGMEDDDILEVHVKPS